MFGELIGDLGPGVPIAMESASSSVQPIPAKERGGNLIARTVQPIGPRSCLSASVLSVGLTATIRNVTY